MTDHPLTLSWWSGHTAHSDSFTIDLTHHPPHALCRRDWGVETGGESVMNEPRVGEPHRKKEVTGHRLNDSFFLVLQLSSSSVSCTHDSPTTLFQSSDDWVKRVA
jgi:hypothetical protein